MQPALSPPYRRGTHVDVGERESMSAGQSTAEHDAQQRSPNSAARGSHRHASGSLFLSLSSLSLLPPASNADPLPPPSPTAAGGSCIAADPLPPPNVSEFFNNYLARPTVITGGDSKQLSHKEVAMVISAVGVTSSGEDPDPAASGGDGATAHHLHLRTGPTEMSGATVRISEYTYHIISYTYAPPYRRDGVVLGFMVYETVYRGPSTRW